MKLAVRGIGRMGLPMARRLCQAGHAVHAWNSTRTKADALAAYDATVHAAAAEAASQADIVISRLENGPVVEHVLFGLGAADGMRPGSLFMDMASIKPAEARDHAGLFVALARRNGMR